MVLIDTGGSLYGYQSDITRTFTISGNSMSDKQKQVWSLVQVTKPPLFAFFSKFFFGS